MNLEQLNRQKLDILAGKFTEEFTTTENQRRQAKEDEWLQSLRQSKCIHDPEVLAKLKANDSKIYSGFTRSKEVPLRAKLNHHLLPEKEKNWEVKATPKPRVDDADLQVIMGGLIRQDDQGTPVVPTDEDIDEAIRAFTEERASRMSEEINDQLVEDQYNTKLKEVIKSGIRFGTGLIKGPETKILKEAKTVFVDEQRGVVIQMLDYIKQFLGKQAPQSGKWEQQDIEIFRPTGKPVSLWRWFPDMSTTEIENCVFADELHSMTKHEMRELAKRGDFFGDVILEVLTRLPQGNYKLRNWETQLSTMQDNQQTPTSQNYEVIERNGFIDGTDLFEAGIINEDKAGLEYFCSFWMLDRKCIKVNLFPAEVISSLADLYHAFYYEKDETSIFGTGLPKVIRDRQLAINAGERHLLNHGAWLVAPCGEINLRQLHPTSAADAQNFGPGWFAAKTTTGVEAGQKALQLYDIQDNSGSIINIVNFQKQQGDQESSLPAYLFGSPMKGSGDETAKGITVRWESLIDFIKDLAKNFDNANTSYIRTIYRWNMKFGNPQNRGDMEIRAIGSAQALIKDAIREAIAYILQSLPEEVKPYFKWEAFAKELAALLFDDPKKFIYSQKEVEENTAAQRERDVKLEDLQMLLMQVKAAYDDAKAQSMLAKAEKTRAELPHDQAKKALDAEKAKTEVVKGNLENVQAQLDMANQISAGGGVSANAGPAK